MRIDAHVHMGIASDYTEAKSFDRVRFMADMKAAGIDGAVLISPDPRMAPLTAEGRMREALEICGGEKTLYPFYWVNPLEEDAAEQVAAADKAGFFGYKMICSNYYPGCRQSMDVLEKIAATGKPVLFHSGICWDGINSADYNRPGNFEALIDIPHLRFCLAHVSWPWYDECIAVYGKFNNAYSLRPDMSSEMFIDVTPGTPRNYREDVWKHLFGNGYDLRYNLIFGTDCSTGGYNTAWAREWQERDDALYDRYVEGDVEDFKEHVYYKNIMRFMGLSDEKPEKVIPHAGA